MPRLAPSTIRQAHNISPHLATLLPACRSLEAARNELRWIREHARSLSRSGRGRRAGVQSAAAPPVVYLETEVLIRKLCEQRAKGVPLQYVLGSQPFGDLDIKCRRSVLIPRPETEAWTFYLAGLVRGELGRAPREGDVGGAALRASSPLRIVDFCSGSGCISLFLAALLGKDRRLRGCNVWGFDVEEKAVDLARENVVHNIKQGGMQFGVARGVKFEKANVFSEDWLRFLRNGTTHDRAETLAEGEMPKIDVLVSNPPYISSHGFNHDTGRSVRNWEPKLALVPEPARHNLQFKFQRTVAPEDVFYARLLEIADMLKPKMAAFEVGDMAQACRVVEMAMTCSRQWDAVEIWRDWPDMAPDKNEEVTIRVSDVQVPVKGSGNGRVVFLRTAS
jgi:methylase of polypeptide subunit release factors